MTVSVCSLQLVTVGPAGGDDTAPERIMDVPDARVVDVPVAGQLMLSLPHDVLCVVAALLDIRSAVALGRTCRVLHARTLARDDYFASLLRGPNFALPDDVLHVLMNTHAPKKCSNRQRVVSL